MARSDRIDEITEWQVGSRRPAFAHLRDIPAADVPAPYDRGTTDIGIVAQPDGQTRRKDEPGERPAAYLGDALASRRLVGLGVTIGAHALLLALFFVAKHAPQPSIAAGQPVVVQLLPAQPNPPQPIPAVEPKLDPVEPAPSPPEIEMAQPEPPILTPSPITAPMPPVQLPLQPVKAAEPKIATSHGPPPSPTAAAAPDATSSFHAQILARLQKYRRYPPPARSRRQEGVVQIRFTMNRGGRVLDQAIVSGSGHPALDREALDTLRRAQPLPPIPADQPDPLQLIVAIDFFVGR